MEFGLEKTIAAPIGEIFAFHSDPANLSLLFEELPGFRLLQHSGTARTGWTTWIEQTVALCLPVVLGFEHTACRPPHPFCVTLIHGPFERFRCLREFEGDDSATLVKDLFDVRLARTFGGEPATRRFVVPRIQHAMRFSYDRLAALASESVRAGSAG